MNELRKDYILNRYVIIATDRAKRPAQLAKQPQKAKKGICFFCSGNENLTPPEIDRIEKDNKWIVRCFPNKFAATNTKGNPKINTKGLIHADAFGKHEVIAETPDHKQQLADLPINHIKLVLEMYQKRLSAISKIKGIKFVSIFKNKGKEAGASLLHAHTQIIAYNNFPTLIQEEIKASKKNKKCQYCSIIRKEKKSKRRIKENKTFVSFTPYASRFPFEAWIFPKKHKTSITELDDPELIDLARQLKYILSKLKKLNAPYNFFLHYAPGRKDLHFHIEIAPRLSTFAGFEFSTGTVINVMSPEKAAAFYRR